MTLKSAASGSTGGGTPPSDLGHVRDYLRVLYKRRWIAAAAFLAVFLWGAIDSLKTTPIYEASAQLLIENPTRSVTSLDGVLDPTMYYDSDFLPTELQILQSRALAQRTINVMTAWDASGLNEEADGSGGSFGPLVAVRTAISGTLDWVAQALGAPAQIEPPAPNETIAQSGQINAFLGGLTVEPIRYTRLVAVRYRSPDPALATEAVNALADQYIQQSIEQRFQASQAANEWLAGQLEEQRREVEQSEAALQQFRETYGTVAVDDQQNVVVQQLAELNAAVIAARTERLDKEATYNQLRGLQTQGDQAAVESFPAILGNAFIQNLKSEVVELQRRHAELSTRYGERHPEMIRATQELQAAQARLQTEIDNVVESVRSDFRTAQAREQSLQQALDAQNRDALGLNRRGIEYAVLEREAASNRQLYENLLSRTNESGVTGEFRGSNVQIVDRAEVPTAPILPRTRRDLMMAALFGCLVAFGLVFGFERLDNRIKSPEEIRAHLGLAYLGLVPSVGRKEQQDGPSPLLTNGAPPRFAEALRAIRTSVVFSAPDEDSRTIVVTSTAPGEGKTVVAANLALALAQAGQRTVLIDGDMRRPRVHEVFGKAQEPGLSNTLVNSDKLEQSLQPAGSGLFVLSAGHLPPNPAELLGSKRYEALLATLRERFDWIIVDAPPVMAVTDAAVLANQAAGVVFVVGAEMTPRPGILAALEQLAAAKAHIIGAVLNRVDVERHSYYYGPYYRKDYTAYYTATPAPRASRVTLQGR